MSQEIKLETTQLIFILAALLPEPTKEEVISVMERERLANPHNDTYKPRRRGELEIKVFLRRKYAKELITVADDKEWVL